jgi:hypothetical protein
MPGHRLFQMAFRVDIRGPPGKLWEALKRRGISMVSCTVSNYDGPGGRRNVFLDCERTPSPPRA